MSLYAALLERLSAAFGAPAVDREDTCQWRIKRPGLTDIMLVAYESADHPAAWLVDPQNAFDGLDRRSIRTESDIDELIAEVRRRFVRES